MSRHPSVQLASHVVPITPKRARSFRPDFPSFLHTPQVEGIPRRCRASAIRSRSAQGGRHRQRGPMSRHGGMERNGFKPSRRSNDCVVRPPHPTRPGAHLPYRLPLPRNRTADTRLVRRASAHLFRNSQCAFRKMNRLHSSGRVCRAAATRSWLRHPRDVASPPAPHGCNRAAMDQRSFTPSPTNSAVAARRPRRSAAIRARARRGSPGRAGVDAA